MTAGIRCPLCCGPMGVVDTREHPGYVRRRRRCDNLGCAGRMKTLELEVPDMGRFGPAEMVLVPGKLLRVLREIMAAIDSSTAKREASCMSPDRSAIPVQDE